MSKFSDICEELVALHNRKSADYGTDADPFHNIRSSKQLGIDPFHGCCVRLGDKWTRLCTFLEHGKLENEPVTDTLLDLASYSIIALALLRESKDGHLEVPAGRRPRRRRRR